MEMDIPEGGVGFRLGLRDSPSITNTDMDADKIKTSSRDSALRAVPALPPRLHLLQRHTQHQLPPRAVSATVTLPTPAPSPSPSENARSIPVNIEEVTPTNTENPTLLSTRPRISSMFGASAISISQLHSLCPTPGQLPTRSFSPALDPVLRRLHRAGVSPVPTPSPESEPECLRAFMQSRARDLRSVSWSSSASSSNSTFSPLFIIFFPLIFRSFCLNLYFYFIASYFNLRVSTRRVSCNPPKTPFMLCFAARFTLPIYAREGGVRRNFFRIEGCRGVAFPARARNYARPIARGLTGRCYRRNRHSSDPPSPSIYLYF